MSYFKRKTPLLTEGLACGAMRQLLQQIKGQRGLTSFIEQHGVNGKWLKTEEPYDITVSKLFRIIAHKAHFQTDDEFVEDWDALGRRLLKQVRMIHGNERTEGV